MIISVNNISFGLERKYFEKKLQEKWPDIYIREITDPRSTELLFWSVVVDKEIFDGYVNDKYISLYGIIDTCAEFAIWFRGIIDQNIDLIVCDNAYLNHVGLDESFDKDVMIKTFCHYSNN